ncbi:putative abieta-7,13-dien-18-ol hydroxylase [Rosa chinensis]|uniref:Putative abieta-7,13-dien-18-ol hydroxylase n=1 Tax=Rosa chinensis TaxID=74649 RepID=A0A2P6SMN3_ROSCH|nr:putative abieta-7,13-dien-18-ol hydroxylase [Rosa chinensis]
MNFLSTAAPPIVIILAVILLAVIFWPLKNKRYPPVAGTVLHQLNYRFTLHHYMTELARNYKTYRILDLFKYVVYTADPANVEYMLKTNFENYGKDVGTQKTLEPIPGLIYKSGRGHFKYASKPFQSGRRLMQWIWSSSCCMSLIRLHNRSRFQPRFDIHPFSHFRSMGGRLLVHHIFTGWVGRIGVKYFRSDGRFLDRTKILWLRKNH